MHGIVLARHDVREVDQIISILTAEQGKCDFVAKGVKKIVSKNTSHLEPCTLISFGIAEGKQEFSYITNVQPVDQFFGIRTSLRTLHIAGYSVDALLRMLREKEDDAGVYRLFFSFIQFLDSAQDVRLLLLDGFLLKLCSLLGYMPLLDACVVCGKTYNAIGSEVLLASEDSGHVQPGWYFAGGGIVCGQCRVEKARIGEQTVVCGLKEINSVAFLLRSDWQDILGYTLDKAEYTKVHTLVYEFVLYHSETQWPDWAKMMA